MQADGITSGDIKTVFNHPVPVKPDSRQAINKGMMIFSGMATAMNLTVFPTACRNASLLNKLVKLSDPTKLPLVPVTAYPNDIINGVMKNITTPTRLGIINKKAAELVFFTIIAPYSHTFR